MPHKNMTDARLVTGEQNDSSSEALDLLLPFLHLMRRAAHSVTHTRLAGTGAPHVQPQDVPVLVALGSLGPSRPGILAQELSLSPSHMSKILSRLADDGLVHRRSDPHDARATLVAPTPVGTTAIDGLLSAARHTIDAIVTDWPTEDVSRLTELVTRLAHDSETHLGIRPTNPRAAHLTTAATAAVCD